MLPSYRFTPFSTPCPTRTIGKYSRSSFSNKNNTNYGDTDLHSKRTSFVPLCISKFVLNVLVHLLATVRSERGGIHLPTVVSSLGHFCMIEKRKLHILISSTVHRIWKRRNFVIVSHRIETFWRHQRRMRAIETVRYKRTSARDARFERWWQSVSWFPTLRDIHDIRHLSNDTLLDPLHTHPLSFSVGPFSKRKTHHLSHQKTFLFVSFFHNLVTKVIYRWQFKVLKLCLVFFLLLLSSTRTARERADNYLCNFM